MKIEKTTGSTPIVWGYFNSPTSGDPIDPTTLLLDVLTPGGTKSHLAYGTDSSVVRAGVGVFRYAMHLAEEGTYHWRWTASGGPDINIVIVGSLDSVLTPSFT